MAYREMRMMDIDQVIRRWLAGERIRAVARLVRLAMPRVKLCRRGERVPDLL